MVTSMNVFDYIKALSSKKVNPQIRIRLSEVLAGFPVQKEKILVLLAELENRGLINIHRETIPSVSLTKYGVQNDSPAGGIESYEP